MNLPLKLFLFLLILLQLILIVHTLKSRKMSMRYGSFWIFILILMSGAVLFPELFINLSDFFGFEAASNMIFLIGFFFLFYIIFILTMSLSKQNATIKTLIQEVSILRERANKNEKKR